MEVIFECQFSDFIGKYLCLFYEMHTELFGSNGHIVFATCLGLVRKKVIKHIFLKARIEKNKNKREN